MVPNRKKLRPAETRYSTFDRELHGVFLAVKHFSYFVEGREFYVLTDHKPLTYALSSRSGNRSPPQFTTDIRYVKGHENVVADALSRLELDTLQVDQQMSPVNFEDMAAAQHNDTELRQLTRDPPDATSLKFQSVPLSTSDSTIVCDMSKGVPRPFVPAAFRRQVFNSLHSLAHPGIKATQHLITDRFVWPRINADVRNWTRACLHCQRAKVQRHTTTSLDRLKPAYLEDVPEPTTFELSPSMPTHSNDTPPALTHSHNPPPAQRTTRFGRHVRWPQRLNL